MMPIFDPVEIEAAQAYRADSTFMHAHKQGWDGIVFRDASYLTFLEVCRDHQCGLDSAIAKSPLMKGLVLYSGHGRGTGAIGALIGDPSRFVGLTYNYPGFISSSTAEVVALDMLNKRATKGSRAVLLEMHLPAGFPALDMSLIPGGGNEFEFLIGRNVDFGVFDAFSTDMEVVGDKILRLKLRPAE